MLKEDGAPVKGAIVTGAGGGIGRAAALVPWISDPLNVVLHQENPEVITAALKACFDPYIGTGRRLSGVA
ncbi:MAG: hypothetical protein ACREI5_03210 [Candidatus Methylomirabilales bacterium]